MEDLGTILRQIAARSFGANQQAVETEDEPAPRCRSCDGTGWLLRTSPAVEVIRCKCKAKEDEEKIAASNVKDLPAELSGSSFDAIDFGRNVENLLEAYQSTVLLMDGELVGLLLEGEAGLGKTLLAACAVQALRKRKQPARFVFVPDLMADLRRCVAENRSADMYLESYARVGFLVLDDFGRGRPKPTPFELDAITRLIQARYQGSEPFMITTNLSFDEVRENYGYGLADRMWSTSERTHYVQLSGASARTNIDYRKLN